MMNIGAELSRKLSSVGPAEFHSLPEEKKKDLKAFCDTLKE